MTFSEHNINRDSDGKFGEKVGGSPEIALDLRPVSNDEVMASFAENEDPKCRRIAATYLADRTILNRLARDEDENVRRAAQGNPSFLAADLTEVDLDWKLNPAFAARNPNFGGMDGDTLESFAKRGTDETRSIIAKSPYTPTSMLEYMGKMETNVEVLDDLSVELRRRENYSAPRIEGLLNATVPSVNRLSSKGGVHQHEVWVVGPDGKSITANISSDKRTLDNGDISEHLARASERYAAAHGGVQDAETQYASIYTRGDRKAAAAGLAEVTQQHNLTRAMRINFYGEA